MRRCSLLLIALLLFAASACDRGKIVEGPLLEQVGPFSATLSWSTDRPLRCRVAFGEGELFDREIIQEQSSGEHRLKLTGLRPSTRYCYRIEPCGFSGSLRTAPSRDGAFDLLLLDSQSPECDGRDAGQEQPDIVVLLQACDAEVAQERHSILTLELPLQEALGMRYGRWGLVLAPDIQRAVNALPIEGAERRIVVLPQLPQAAPPELAQDVLVSAQGALYQGRRLNWNGAGRLEVDAFELAAIELVDGDRVRKVIVQAPPETRKSCLYCDRLLESGRYEESLAWYRDFVSQNRERHEIEDALYQIALILDEKLHRYDEALQAFRSFLQRYPEGRRAPLAEYRLNYLLGHADDNFEPLRLFEGAKASLVADDPLPAAEQVELLIDRYPQSTIVPEALLWLAHLLEQQDEKRAREYYALLIQRFPQSPNAPLAAIAVGDVHYKHNRYRSAIAAYEQALSIAPPSFQISIEEKLNKSHRNIRREAIHLTCWALLAIWVLITAWLRARPNADDLAYSAVVAALFASLIGGYFSLTYENTRELLPVICALAGAMTLVLLWSRALGTRLHNRPGWLLLLHTLSCSLAAAFLVMYWFHFLYLFGL
ncbi:MAG: tetratricopeptide repeat protein [Candidatus Alcyoniella australis]|nr:tetratricopeptide repeat protein [Candidatus Alcyoniella australis]